MSEGTQGDDTLTGGAEDELLAGLAGDDRLRGAAGEDTLEGGAGLDTAVFGGGIDGYRFAQADGWLVVTDTNPTDGDDGTDLLRGIEALEFAGTRVRLAAGGELRVNDETFDAQRAPALAQLGDGGHVVVWESWIDFSNNWDVLAMRFDAHGAPVGEPFRVNSERVEEQSEPTVAALVDGGFVVAWSSYGQDGSRYGVYAQRFAADGAPSGPEFLVSTETGDDQDTPAVVGLADGGFVVCWQSFLQDGEAYGIYGQRYDADGERSGGEFRLNQETASSQREVQLAALPDGGFIAVWNSNQGDGGLVTDDVYARRYDASGDPAGDEFRVNADAAGYQFEPVVAVREDGVVAIAWRYNAGSGGNILLQVFDADGARLGAEIVANATTFETQEEPTLAFVPGSGELVVGWSSYLQDGSSYGVYARAFGIEADGVVAASAEFLVNTRAEGAQFAPVIAGAAGGFLLAWASGPQDGSDLGVYLQRFVPAAPDGAASPAWPWSHALPTLRGSIAPERFDLGGAGFDLAAAGAGGDDVYVLDSAGDRAIERAGGGIDRIETPLAWSLRATPDIEDLRLTGVADVAGSGNAAGNRLWGNDGRNLLLGAGGDDTLDGGDGADTLRGGMGDDTYVLRDGLDAIEERAGGGTDTLLSERIETTLPARIENLVLSGSAALDGYGNRLANVLSGSAVANLLDGRAGADTLAGGRGDDIYRVDEAGDRVVEHIGEGTDTVLSTVSFTLSAHVEQLKLDGDAPIDGAGNFLANVIEGNAADNRLDGGTGADVLIGLGGDDTYHVDQSADTVIETAGGGHDTVLASDSFTLPAFVEGMRFVDAVGGTRNYAGTGNAEDNLLEGAAGDDALNGLGGNDTLLGYAGDDTLSGGEGADSMLGGSGDDVYAIDDAGDVYVEVDGEGAADEVRSLISHTLLANVEHLRLLGSAGIDGAGNASANRVDGNGGGNGLAGGEGNDTLDGGEGVDTMDGGDGDDLYFVDDADDIAEESDPPLLLSPGAPHPAAVGTNIDTVISQVSYTLRANIENLELAGGGNLAGTGNELDNLLAGNGGANLLRGLDGTDILDGGAGNDTLDGGTGRDTLGGGAGDDTYVVGAGDRILEFSQQGRDTVQSAVAWTLARHLEVLVLDGSANIAATGNDAANELRGNAGRNLVTGGGGNDTLAGGGGADTLSGGAGNDELRGGAGADAFLFEGPLAGNVDTLVDFTPGSDVIRLDDDVFGAFAAGVAVEAAQIRAGAGFTMATTAEHRLIYNATNGALYYDGDGAGGAAAARIAMLATVPTTLAAEDFLIVA